MLRILHILRTQETGSLLVAGSHPYNLYPEAAGNNPSPFWNPFLCSSFLCSSFLCSSFLCRFSPCTDSAAVVHNRVEEVEARGISLRSNSRHSNRALVESTVRTVPEKLFVLASTVLSTFSVVR